MSKFDEKIERMTDSAYEIIDMIGEYGKAEFLTVLATVLSAYADVHGYDAVMMSLEVLDTLGNRALSQTSVKPHKVSIN